MSTLKKITDYSAHDLENEVLRFWKDDNTFAKSVQQRPADNAFRFYDGPPFITGLPHYGHLLGSICKDIVPRYQAMQGKRVERVWGWDCHGIPVEEKVQSKLGLENSHDVHKAGLEKFIQECYAYTNQVSGEWKWYIDRIGRWVDMDNSYRTMDQNYMESTMWVFSELYKRGMVYKGKRVSLYSTKLETPISNFEVAMDNSYEEVNDPAITVMFDLSENGDAWKNTYALAWTTTPWTIPANMALAINKDLEYVKVTRNGTHYIVAKNRADAVFKGIEYETIMEINPNELVGLSYTPPFDYYKGEVDAQKNHKIYHADFITDTDGTGIGHEAPEFGDVDFDLAQQNGIHISEAMNPDGTYSKEIRDYAGMYYRDLNEPLTEELKNSGWLFKKEGITHRVAMCPRTKIPLVHKAQDSWFVDIQSIKNKLLEANEDVCFFPEHFKHGRFAKNIEVAPDWCISRTRFWATPMPLWQNDEDPNDVLCVNGRDEIFHLNKPNGDLCKVILVRHGRTDYNEQKWADHKDDSTLNEQGKSQAQEVLDTLQDVDIDAIYSSPLTRCTDTVAPLARAKHREVQTRDDLREFDRGDYQGKYHDCGTIRFDDEQIGGGESAIQVYERCKQSIQEIIQENAGKTVVICSHGDPLTMIRKALIEFDYDTQKYTYYPKNGSVTTHYVDIDRQTDLDLHRPYIDRIKLCQNGKQYTRMPEVLDVWMDSGSMPYSQMHYPFENKDKMEQNFPADYIAEYVGQIRAWFYVLHVLGVALFQKPAFKNVVTTGIIWGTDGRKMSKSLQNYPDPKETLDTYGADAFRMYIASTPLVSGGDVNFSEEGLKEAFRKVILPLWNSYRFYKTYADIDGFRPTVLDMTTDKSQASSNVLDTWLISKTQELVGAVQTSMDAYDMQAASRELYDFMDNLTNWYVRRSRRRFWKSENDSDKIDAYNTLHVVLMEVCKVAAPFIPFVSDYIYKDLSGEESVHLANFPNYDASMMDKELIASVQKVRNIIRLGLSYRSQRNIRVRQPLHSLSVSKNLSDEEKQLIAEELNVKEVRVFENPENVAQKVCKPDARILGPRIGKDVQRVIKEAKSGNFEETSDGVQVAGYDLHPGEYEMVFQARDESLDIESDGEIIMSFDTHITPELEAEGDARDMVRVIQEMRKNAGYNASDRIVASIGNIPQGLQDWKDYIASETLITNWEQSMQNPDIQEILDLVSGIQTEIAIAKA